MTVLHCGRWIEPISIEKSCRLASVPSLSAISFISPNQDELVALGVALGLVSQGLQTHEQVFRAAKAALVEYNALPNEAARLSRLRHYCGVVLNTGIQNVVITCGSKGAIWACAGPNGTGLSWKFVRAVHVPASELKNSNGAGDCFVGACVAALLQGSSVNEALEVAVHVASLTVKSHSAVSPFITPKLLHRSLPGSRL